MKAPFFSRLQHRYAAVGLVIGLLTLAGCSAAALHAFREARGVLTGVEGSHRSGPSASQHYRLVWDDEFNGPAGAPPSPAKWEHEVGGDGWGNDELQYYTDSPSNASLDGAGHLAITARRETYTGPDGVTRQYTSAELQTSGRFQTKYGRIEARIKLPAGSGLWPAFWAIGADFPRVGWPASGEIDLMENVGSNPFRVIGVLHGPQAGRPNGYSQIASDHSTASFADGFHTFGIDWSPGKVVFTCDGVSYATRTPASLPPGGKWVFDRPFYLILDLAVGGHFPGPPNASTQFPATMLVDWVRVYKGS
jgi:beta-glucanase (GH16 family)